MDNQYRFLVPEESHGERMDKFLAQSIEDSLSRERIQALVEEGRVCVNGSIRQKVSYRLGEGDEVCMTVPAPIPLDLKAEAIPLDVVYEDTHLLVVNKPAGMLTHPTGREQEGTLVNALLGHCGHNLSGINGVIRPGIVHRLDRDTSGLLVIAKTDQAHQYLSAQLKAKTMRREYNAIVQGTLPQPQGTVEAPIGRNPKHRDKMCVDPTGRPAVTHWQVLEEAHGKFSRLQLRLETGRTHQIRVHMAHIGHPVLGDPLYGSGIEKQLKIKSQGQLLQAFRLSLIHPISEELMTFEIPTDPDIERLWAWLQDAF